MNDIGKPESRHKTASSPFSRDVLGYRYLGDWTDRADNSNIEEILLKDYLLKIGYTPAQINIALDKLHRESDNHTRSLYENNKAVYDLLRYGVPVKIEAGKVTETVHLINWNEPEKNDFVIVEEVTLRGDHERRPDIVLYVNGIAVAVLELKRSSASIGDGIRQSISNHRPSSTPGSSARSSSSLPATIRRACATVRSEPRKSTYLTWKEDEQDDTSSSWIST